MTPERWQEVKKILNAAHETKHARIQTGNRNRRIQVRAIRSSAGGSRIDHAARQRPLARIVVGNESDVAESQPMTESFVIAEEERPVFVDRTSE